MELNQNNASQLVESAFRILKKKEAYDRSIFSSPVDAATPILERALQLDPLCYPALTELARCYSYYSERYADALSLLQRAIEISPDDPIPHYEGGLIYLHAGERGMSLSGKECSPEALSHFRRAGDLGYEPRSWLYNHIGITHFRMRDYREAIAWFEESFKSLLMEGTWIPSTFYLGAKASEEVGDVAGALMWYERCKSEGRAGGLDENIDERIEVLRKISKKPRVLQRIWLRIYKWALPW